MSLWSRTWRICASAVLTLGTWNFTVHAQAAAQDLALTWQAPPDCPQRQWFEERVARVRGASGSGAGIRVEVEVEPTAAGYSLVLRTENAGVAGERTLQGARCEELVEAAAVIVAVSFPVENSAPSADASTPAVPPQPPPSVQATPPAATPVSAVANESRRPPAPTAARRVAASREQPVQTRRERSKQVDRAPSRQQGGARASSARWSLGAQSRWLQSVLPKSAFEVGVRADVRWRAVTLGVGAGIVNTSATLSLVEPVDFARYGLWVNGGYVARWVGDFEWAVLGTLDAALLVAGRGADENARNLTLAIGLGPALFWRPASAFRVGIELAVAVSPRRATLRPVEVDGAANSLGEVWISSLFNGWAGLGACFVF